MAPGNAGLLHQMGPATQLTFMVVFLIAIFLIATYALYTRARGQFWSLFVPIACFAALAHPPAAAADLPPLLSAFSQTTGTEPPPPWRAVGLPKGKAPLTRMDIATLDGERVLRLTSSKSYGTLSHALPRLTLGPQATLRWKWRLEQGLPTADLRRKDADDSPLRVCALFDLPLDNLGLMERSLMRLARSSSGEALPAATLCYVWDHQLPTGVELANAYTRRVRFIVLNSGAGRPGAWVAHDRALTDDFLRVFKDDLGTGAASVPPLLAIVVGADSDNTGGASLGYIGDVVLKP